MLNFNFFFKLTVLCAIPYTVISAEASKHNDNLLEELKGQKLDICKKNISNYFLNLSKILIKFDVYRKFITTSSNTNSVDKYTHVGEGTIYLVKPRTFVLKQKMKNRVSIISKHGEKFYYSDPALKEIKVIKQPLVIEMMFANNERTVNNLLKQAKIFKKANKIILHITLEDSILGRQNLTMAFNNNPIKVTFWRLESKKSKLEIRVKAIQSESEIDTSLINQILNDASEGIVTKTH